MKGALYSFFWVLFVFTRQGPISPSYRGIDFLQWYLVQVTYSFREFRSAVIVSRRQHFPAYLHILWLAHSFHPSSVTFLECWHGVGVNINVPFRVEHSAATYSKHLNQFRVPIFADTHCRKKPL